MTKTFFLENNLKETRETSLIPPKGEGGSVLQGREGTLGERHSVGKGRGRGGEGNGAAGT